MKSKIVTLTFLLGAGLGFPTLAADYTWLGKTANWLDALNWRAGGSDVTWANGNAAVFEAGGPNLNIAIGGAVSPSQMTIRDSYVFSGIGPVTLDGFCYVAENKTATYEVPLKATTQFKKGAVGTAVIKGGADFAKMLVNTGTLRLAEGTTVKVTAASTAASTDSSLALTGGDLVLEKGSTLELTGKSDFAPNSGSGVMIAGGTLSVTNAGEFLIGFNDINKSGGTMKSKRSFVTVADGGKLLAKTIRLSKATKTEITTNPEYGRLNLNTNGFVSANNIYIEKDTFHGVINFNGGVLEHNPTQTQINNKTYAMISHANMSLQVKEGGAHLKLVNGSLNRTFATPFVSAAEQDGGFTIEGDGGVAYMNVTNTFNGPTTLTGTGGLIYVPKYDRSLGLEPPAPTNNIIAASGMTTKGPILHSDYAFDLHKNRNVLIKKNSTFFVGNSDNLRLLGQINSDPAAPTSTVLQVVGNWAGAFTIATTDGRENKIGRVRSDGHLVFENGTTTVTKVTDGVAGNAPIYAARTSTATAYSKNYGVIEVTGGLLKAVTGAKYTETQNYGQIKVSGGKLDVSGNNQELLNAMDTPGKIEVSGTGEIAAYIVRATQVASTSAKAYTNDLPTACIHVATGGVLRLHHFSIDYGKSSLAGRIDLDGGTIICRSSQNKLIGSPDNLAKWEKILTRVCPGGAIVDTANTSSGIPVPLISACANDGGVCKLGAGTLTLSGANTYNGPTRCDKGTLKFANEGAFPGGDLAISAKALKTNGSLGTIKSPKLVFKSGAKVRIVDADGVDPKTCNRVTIATSEAEIVNPPSVAVVVDKDGNVIPGGVEWRVSLSADRRTLQIGKAQGCAIIFR